MVTEFILVTRLFKLTLSHLKKLKLKNELYRSSRNTFYLCRPFYKSTACSRIVGLYMVRYLIIKPSLHGFV
jgi:hypothetical protein